MITAADIISRLRKKYAAVDGWVLETEIQVGQGRRIDVLALNVWPSKRWCIAFEIKVNTVDFRRELSDPTKRAPAVDLANEFFYVAPRGIIPEAEVPEECGLIEALDGETEQLRFKKRAKQYKDHATSERLWYALLNRYRQAQEVDQQAVRTQQADPTFRLAGKELTLEQFKDLSLRYWEQHHCRRLDQEVSWRVREERRKDRATALNDQWTAVIPSIVRLARKRLGLGWQDQLSVRDIERWLDLLSGVSPVTKTADFLRGLLLDVEKHQVFESIDFGDDE